MPDPDPLQQLFADAQGHLRTLWLKEAEGNAQKTHRAHELIKHMEALVFNAYDWGVDEAEIESSWDLAQFILGCMASEIYTVAEDLEEAVSGSINWAADMWVEIMGERLNRLKGGE